MEQTITFAVAKLAKGKGFKTDTKRYHYKKDGIVWSTANPKGISGKEDTVQLVTYAQLYAWIRKKNIAIVIAPSSSNNKNWYYNISFIDKVEWITEPELQNISSYNQAVRRAFIRALNLLP